MPVEKKSTKKSALEEFTISDEYLVRTSGTSDGTQDKYYKDGLWFKLDRFGGEGLAETAASLILKESGLSSNFFVEYHPCLINGKQGCYSKNFLKENESFITLYRLYKNVTGRDLATVTSKMDYDDAIEYTVNFIKEHTKLDIREYLANTFYLDMLILNEDRHFNNLGLIFDEKKFHIGPIFDNGKSFLIGNQKAKDCKTLEEKIKHAYAKAFSPSFQTNYNYLKKYCTLKVNPEVLAKIKDLGNTDIMDILKKTLKN